MGPGTGVFFFIFILLYGFFIDNERTCANLFKFYSLINSFLSVVILFLFQILDLVCQKFDKVSFYSVWSHCHDIIAEKMMNPIFVFLLLPLVEFNLWLWYINTKICISNRWNQVLNMQFTVYLCLCVCSYAIYLTLIFTSILLLGLILHVYKNYAFYICSI